MDATLGFILIFVLAILLVAVGLGLSRRAKRADDVDGTPGERPPAGPVSPTATLPRPPVETPGPEDAIAEAGTAEPEVELGVEIAPPPLRDRLGKTRAAFARLRGKGRIERRDVGRRSRRRCSWPTSGCRPPSGSSPRCATAPSRRGRATATSSWACCTPSWWRCSTRATDPHARARPPTSRTSGCSSASTASGRPRPSPRSRSGRPRSATGSSSPPPTPSAPPPPSSSRTGPT